MPPEVPEVSSPRPPGDPNAQTRWVLDLDLAEIAQVLDRTSGMIACYAWPECLCLYSNSAYAAIGGWQPDDLLGRTFAELWGADLFADILPMMSQAMLTGEPVHYSGERHTPIGRTIWIDVQLIANRDRSRIYFLLDEVRGRSASGTQTSVQRRLERFFLASTAAVAFIRKGRLVDVNARFAALIGFEPHELQDVPVERVLIAREPHESLRAGVRFLRHRSGQHVQVELTAHDLLIDGRAEQLLLASDVGQEPRSAEQLRHLALHDALTGLPNRAHLDQYLRASVATAESLGHRFAIVFLDIDRFKRVNDSLGHAAGDRLLLECARRLRDFCAEQAAQSVPTWVARAGGDEFVLFIALGDGSDVEIGPLIAELRRTLAAPTQLGGREFAISASIGVAIFPDHGSAPDELIKNADTAMYAAKAGGRDTVRTFAPALAKAALQALNLESEMLNALERREFALYFQPIMTESGRLASAEALLRWKHPRRGVLAPDHFIELAESSRAMAAIGLWVLEEALRQATLWTKVGWLNARVAVNLSGTEFRSEQFIPTLETMLRRFGLSGRALEVELTERIVMSDELGVYTTLEVLKSLGVTVAIDDFGTGYSSFARLRELPVDRIKIASEFVRDLPDSPACRAIVHSIAELARGLGLSLVAEGVESQAQLDALQLLGCREAQGYLFGKPMSSGDFGRWLRHNQVRWLPQAA